MNTPELQSAIRLLDFLATSVQMDVPNPFDIDPAQNTEVNVGVSIGFNDNDLNHYSIHFEVSVVSKNLTMLVKTMALFETKAPIDEGFKSSGFVQTNSPAIAFPFVRSFITTLTSNAGIRPVILPAFNFSGIPVKQ